MTLQTVLSELPDGAACFDCYEPLTIETAAAMRSLGYVAAGRYLENLSLAEVSAILTSGLGLEPISTCAAPGWIVLGSPAGQLKGLGMAHRAKGLGLPAGLPLCIDWETPARDTDPTLAAQWIEAAASEIVAAGFVAALYWGACPILSGVAAARIPSVTLYYKSASDVPEVPYGYVLVQTALNRRVGPLTVDLDTAQADKHDPPRRMTALFAGSSQDVP